MCSLPKKNPDTEIYFYINTNYPQSHCPVGLQRKKEKPKNREMRGMGSFGPGSGGWESGRLSAH